MSGAASGFCFRASLIFLALVFGTIATPLHGQVSEFAVKVEFIYNFTKFITWPSALFEGQSRSFNICTYGPALDSLLDGLASKTAQNYRLQSYTRSIAMPQALAKYL